MHIYLNEIEIYKDRLKRDLKTTYKHITFTIIASDINDYVDKIFVTIIVEKLNLQRSLKFNVESYSTMLDLDRHIKMMINDSISNMLHNYFIS